MKYKNHYNKIVEAMNWYKEQVDAQEQIYLNRKKQISDSVADMRSENKFTEEYINEYAKKTRPQVDDIKGKVSNSRNATRDIVEQELKSIRKEADSYFNAPINPDFALKVQSYNSLGVKLSNAEFKLLEKSAHSYGELRLLNQLAENRTKTIEAAEVIDKDNPHFDGNARTVKKEVADKYNGVELPSLDYVYKQIELLEGKVRHCLNGYIGQTCNSGLVEIAEKDSNNNYYPLSFCATADTFFHEESNQDFLDTMDKANSILIDVFKPEKRVLTSGEIEFIDSIIDPKYQTLVKSTALKMAELSPDFKDMLKADDRYSGLFADDIAE